MREPEKPAKKCGSIKPSARSRSAWAAMRLMMQEPPEGRVPIWIMASSSVATCITISSFATISSPYLSTSSLWVEGRCMPVATRMRTRACGAAAWMRRSRMGMVTFEGTGRVWSELMITMSCLFWQSSSSVGDEYGLSRARSISCSWVPLALNSPWCPSSTPAMHSSGRLMRSFVRSYGTSMSNIAIPFCHIPSLALRPG